MNNGKIVEKCRTNDRWFPRLKRRSDMAKSSAPKRAKNIKHQPLVLVADK